MAKEQKIVIHETFKSSDELVALLEEITRLVNSGMTSGYHPGWEIQEA